MIKSRFYVALEANLDKSTIGTIIENTSFDESCKCLRGLAWEAKHKKSAEIFELFCKDLDELNILNKHNVQFLLKGIKNALTSEDEEYLYRLIYELERLKKQITSQKDEIKNSILISFKGIEGFAKDAEFEQKSEILAAINDVLINELKMQGILKEASESAFLSTIENGDDVEDTAREIAKNIVYRSILEGEFKKSRFMEISNIVISQAISIANESKIFADELIAGAVEGSNDGISKAIEKFKDDLKFAPDEIVENLGDSQKEVLKVEDEFIELLRTLASICDEPAKEVLNTILQKDYDSYFAKMKRISADAREQIAIKIAELSLNKSYKEFSRSAGLKFEEIKSEFAQKREKFIENFDLEERMSNFKKEFIEFERKAAEKFNEIIHAKRNKTEKENGEEVGNRAYEAAKENLKESEDDNKSAQNKE